MLIKEFRFTHASQYMEAVQSLRIPGAVLAVQVHMPTVIYIGHFVASHPERMSMSLLVDTITQKE